MKEITTYRRLDGSSASGCSIQITKVFSSFNPQDIDILETQCKHSIGTALIREFDGCYTETESSELKQQSYRIVLQDLLKNNMFNGRYDAVHGSREFMHGIGTVMEAIAEGISEDAADDFMTEFSHNMSECESKAEDNGGE